MKRAQQAWLMAILLVALAISGCSARASGVASVAAAPEAQATAAAAPGAAVVSLTADKGSVAKDEQFKVTVVASNVKDLYAADVRLQFDPNKLEVVDSNPSVPGTQIEVGKLLDPSAGQGFVAQNAADNAAGRVSYAVTLLSPAKAVSGDGPLAVITFKAKEAQNPAVTFLNALLTKQDNATIAATTRPLGTASAGPIAPAGAAPAAQATAATAAQATAAPKAAAQATAAPGAAAVQAATVSIDPASASVAVNGTTQVAVKIAGVTNFYGADVRLSFDAAKVEVVDADNAQQGVQVTQGDCFPAGSQTARNIADNTAGTIIFASSRVAPAPGVNGGCTIITITFKGKAAGASPVQFSRAPQIADSNGNPISATATGGNVTVGGGVQPTGQPTGQPTAQPTGQPTAVPTAVPTETPGGGTPPPSGGSCTYTVVAGDTLSSIALRYNTTVAALVAANGLSDPNAIRVGQTLIIPNCSGPVQPPPSGGCITYVVRPGDTLSSIARRYGTSAAAIAQANNLSNPNLIRVGQRLIVCPGPGGGTPPPPPGPVGRTYVVRPGDTLSGIALRFNTTVWSLQQANGLANPNLIFPGQVLHVP